MPKIENRLVRHFVTVVVDKFAQGKANGKREYSSTNVSIYRAPVDEGSGPLKSILTLSKGRVAFTKCASSGL